MSELGLARSVGVFSSDLFDIPPPPRIHDKAASPLGHDLARLLFTELDKVAVPRITRAGPVAGEDGWIFWCSLDGRGYSVFVHWAPIGEPPSDHWVVQIDARVGLLRAFLGKRASDDEVAPVREELARILDRPGVRDLRWLTMKEFGRVY